MYGETLLEDLMLVNLLENSKFLNKQLSIGNLRIIPLIVQLVQWLRLTFPTSTNVESSGYLFMDARKVSSRQDSAPYFWNRKYTGPKKCRRIGSIGWKNTKYFQTSTTIPKKINYIWENHGWTWNLVWEPKWYLAGFLLKNFAGDLKWAECYSTSRYSNVKRYFCYW